jgi:hypothetical protein
VGTRSFFQEAIFALRSSLFFFTMVHYRSFAPFGIFKVRSSLFRSLKIRGSLLRFAETKTKKGISAPYKPKNFVWK